MPALDARRTVILLWAIAGFTLGLIVLVLWSILAPLRRLTRRARGDQRRRDRPSTAGCQGAP